MFEYIYRKARINTYSSDIFDSGLVPRFWYVPHKKSQRWSDESWIRGDRDTLQLSLNLSNLTMNKTLKRDVFHLVTSMGQRQNSESPWGIKPQTLQILCSNALPLSHRDSMVSEVYYEVHITHVLHTARNSAMSIG